MKICLKAHTVPVAWQIR